MYSHFTVMCIRTCIKMFSIGTLSVEVNMYMVLMQWDNHMCMNLIPHV